MYEGFLVYCTYWTHYVLSLAILKSKLRSEINTFKLELTLRDNTEYCFFLFFFRISQYICLCVRCYLALLTSAICNVHTALMLLYMRLLLFHKNYSILSYKIWYQIFVHVQRTWFSQIWFIHYDLWRILREKRIWIRNRVRG